MTTQPGSLGGGDLVNKKAYLTNPFVDQFVRWFAGELVSPTVENHYEVVRPRQRFHFVGLADAFRQYQWEYTVTLPGQAPQSGSSFADNQEMLRELAAGLAGALNAGSVPEMREWVLAVLQWGGVKARNVRWLKANSDLLHEIAAPAAFLGLGDDDIGGLRDNVHRFNSAMTKAYSLIVPNFIIYDSRVAGALAWFVARWCRRTGRGQVPELLAFGCLPARSTVNRKLRNPTTGGLIFQEMKGRPAIHAHWNLRASWLLEAVLQRTSSPVFRNAPNPLRALEAALFMWGYDLTHAETRPNAGRRPLVATKLSSRLSQP